MIPLDQLWERLQQVRALTFVARSGKPHGWNGAGQGVVIVELRGESMLTFTEAGTWKPEGGQVLSFHNIFRWSKAGDALRLEHLRYGVDHPVNLFDLASSGEEWRSISPHACSADCYAARLLITDEHLLLHWSIVGPRKQETIEYRYWG